MRTYILKVSGGTLKIRFLEQPDRILYSDELRGKADPKEEVQTWLSRIYEQYKGDPRPFEYHPYLDHRTR